MNPNMVMAKSAMPKGSLSSEVRDQVRLKLACSITNSSFSLGYFGHTCTNYRY